MALGPNTANAQDQPVTNVQVLTPRPFGYVIGDEIRHEIQFETLAPYKLQMASLPTKGRVNYWLTLKDVELGVEQQDNSTAYKLTVIYQTFYAPLSVKDRETPSFTLKLQGDAKTHTFKVPAWEFTMSPLHEIKIRKVGGKYYIRPDERPPLIGTGPILIQLAALIAAALVSLVYLAYYYGIWPFGSRKRRPFAHAKNILRRLRRKEPDPDTAYKNAVKAIHQAFNLTEGTPVFRDKLEKFFTHHSKFIPLRDDINLFFIMSRRVFFAKAPKSYIESYPLSRLESLCWELADVERRL